MPIKAVIFDLGGVLLRTEDQESRRELVARLGIQLREMYYLVFDSPSARQASLGQVTVEQHWEAIRDALGLSEVEIKGVAQEFWAGDRLDTSLVDAIRSLRPRYKTALLSNAWDDLRGYLTDRWEIADAFDELVISAEVGLVKPDSRIYQLALDRLDAAPSEAIFVDDFIENIEAARALGINAIHFLDPPQALAELKAILDN